MMTGPTKAAREAIAATQTPRTKPLDKPQSRWRMLAGIGAALLVGGAMCALAGGMILGFIGH